ncbi:hypothetical protein IVA80_32105 [Bradyrhizobium sp. 139]|uniref:hypothetical protein n=1 Tax=Bradyrhizobium sp. 139 TaxID=2782616 RepID=UPI001FF8595B|nr:hypothetical protein [Bradyrhizobium sp. 139]MCK1745297.1 hypothetical protein [Bradyrhizobium sp. 139]
MKRRLKRGAREKARERRQQAVVKAQAALEKSEREHDQVASTIEAERAMVENRSQAEEAR